MKSFKQQQLSAWQPVLTPVSVIAMLLIIFVIFLPIGILLEDCSNRVIEQKVRYDNVGGCDDVDSTLGSDDLPKFCEVDFEIEYDMETPIYFYYELVGFYQNHRRYSSSKSYQQLRGDAGADTSDCTPLTEYGDDTLVPCGMFAGSFFEDRFTMEYQLPGETGFTPLCAYEDEDDPCYMNEDGESTDWSWNDLNSDNETNWAAFYDDTKWVKDGIAWDTDVNDKFAADYVLGDGESNAGPRQVLTGLDMPSLDDEDFIVWMRTAALPNFRKLHRVIPELAIGQTTLEAGSTVTVRIASWFPTKEFDGQKWIVLAKTEWCGGANHALAWTYIVVASVAIGLTVSFAILLLFGTRKMANVHMFKWHNFGVTDPMDRAQ